VKIVRLINRLRKTRATAFTVVGLSVSALLILAGGWFVLGQRRVQASGVAGVFPPSVPGAMPLGLPSEDSAKALLNASLKYHHPLWVDVPMGSVKIRTFVLYPDLAGKAPVVVVTAKNQGLSDWVRAVGADVVNEGMIAVVPDLLSGLGPNGGGTDSFANREAVAMALGCVSPAEIQRRTTTVRDYFANQPGSNGKSAILDFDWKETRLDAAIKTPEQQRTVKFELTEHAWHSTLPLLASLAEPGPATPQNQSANSAAPKDAYAAAAATQRAAEKEIAQRHDIVAMMWDAKKVADNSPRKGQWVDFPVTTEREGAVKLHAWLVQPLGNDKAGVVVVIHPTPGMDMAENPHKGEGANWMRAVADEIAAEGFIAIAPDLTSGLAPGGGNFDSFVFPDDVAKAINSRPEVERMEFAKAARDYALKLPRANGKSGMIGFCLGGTMSWEAAAVIPGLNAAVSYYGWPPDPATMAKIQAPVIAFVGEMDPGLAPIVAAAAPDMQRLGKTFEYKIYPGTTHAFLYQRFLAENAAATLDSWPKAMALFKRYLSGS